MFQTIQVCRAVAAILVVLYHTSDTLAKEKYFGLTAFEIEKLFNFGGKAGVAFFFVLSGFIITYVHYRDFSCPEKIYNYLYKRAVRIYPTYIIIFMSVYLITISIPQLRGTMPTDPVILVKSLFLLPQDPRVVGTTGAPVIGVAWSLQYEILFYSLFATAIINRWFLFVIVTVFVVNYLFQFISLPYEFPRSFLSSHYILLFGIGMITSVAIRSRIYPKNSSLIASCAIAAFFLIGIISNNFKDLFARSIFDFAYGSMSAIIIFALIRFESENVNSIKSKLPSMLGDSSYALYLIHYPIISLLCKLAIIVLPNTTFWVYVCFFIIVMICILAGLMFHILIEKPLLKKINTKSLS